MSALLRELSDPTLEPNLLLRLLQLLVLLLPATPRAPAPSWLAELAVPPLLALGTGSGALDRRRLPSPDAASPLFRLLWIADCADC